MRPARCGTHLVGQERVCRMRSGGGKLQNCPCQHHEFHLVGGGQRGRQRVLPCAHGVKSELATPGPRQVATWSQVWRCWRRRERSEGGVGGPLCSTDGLELKRGQGTESPVGLSWCRRRPRPRRAMATPVLHLWPVAAAGAPWALAPRAWLWTVALQLAGPVSVPGKCPLPRCLQGSALASRRAAPSRVGLPWPLRSPLRPPADLSPPASCRTVLRGAEEGSLASSLVIPPSMWARGSAWWERRPSDLERAPCASRAGSRHLGVAGLMDTWSSVGATPVARSRSERVP